MMNKPQKAVLIGATGAVGKNVLRALLDSARFTAVTTLGRRTLPPEDQISSSPKLSQHVIDLWKSATYEALLSGHEAAFCTLGVGQPTKLPREEVLRTDVEGVMEFAAACKRQGVRHFSLMTAVGADPKARYWYLRMKGELEQKVAALGFERTSFF